MPQPSSASRKLEYPAGKVPAFATSADGRAETWRWSKNVQRDSICLDDGMPMAWCGSKIWIACDHLGRHNELSECLL